MENLKIAGRWRFPLIMILTCLFVALFSIISHTWGIRFTTMDDAKIARWAIDGHDYVNGLAKGQGRIYFYYHVPILLFGESLWQTPWWDISQSVGFSLSISLVGLVLGLYVSPTLGFLSVLVYLASITLVWDHTLITSIPLFHYVVVINVCLTLLALYRFRITGVRLWLVVAVALYALSVWGQEYQVVISTTLFFVCARCTLPQIPAPGAAVASCGRRSMILVAVIAILYVASVLLWRLKFGNVYDGADISPESFDIKAFFGVLGVWAVSAFIYPYWLHNYTIHPNVGGRGFMASIDFSPSNIMAMAEPILLVKVAAVAVAAIALMRMIRSEELRGKARWGVPLLALLVMLVPTFLLGLTPKYQGWFKQGVMAYTYTSISAYGFAVLLAWLIVFTHNLIVSSGGWRWFVRAGVVATLVAGAATADYQGSVVSRAMREATARWTALDILMRSPLRAEFEGKVVLAPRLINYYWAVPTQADYWDLWVQEIYRSKAKFPRTVTSVAEMQGEAPFYFDFARLSGTGQVAAMLSKTSYADEMFLTKQVRVIAASNLIASVTGIDREGKPFRIWLPGVTPQRQGDYRIYTVDLPSMVEAPYLRLDDQTLWAPPKFAEAASFRSGVPIIFSAEGNGRLFHVSGWGQPEVAHTWTLGRESHLSVRPNRPATCDLQAKLDAWSFFIKGQTAEQALTIKINGAPVWTGRVGEPGQIAFTIPRIVWDAATPVDIAFEHPEARSPASLGISQDTRQLAIGVQRLLIEDCDSAASSAFLYRLGDTIDFSSHGNARPYLGGRWGEPEQRHSWALGKSTSLTMTNGRVPACNLKLEAEIFPFYVAGKMKAPYLNIFVNDVEVGRIATFDQAMTISLPVPRLTWLKNEPTTIRFEHPHARSPKSLGMSGDTRELAVGFNWLKVRENCRSN